MLATVNTYIFFFSSLRSLLCFSVLFRALRRHLYVYVGFAATPRLCAEYDYATAYHAHDYFPLLYILRYAIADRMSRYVMVL